MKTIKKNFYQKLRVEKLLTRIFIYFSTQSPTLSRYLFSLGTTFLFRRNRTPPPAHANSLWPPFSPLQLREISGRPDDSLNAKTNWNVGMLVTTVMPLAQRWFPFPSHPFRISNFCTGRLLTESDDTRCCSNTIWPPEDEQNIARNM